MFRLFACVELEPAQKAPDPEDGVLYLSSVKPGETQMEARRDTDVQIDHQTWVYGRKTNRTIS